MGVRMSLLGNALFCPMSAQYAEQRGESILARMGSAFHARCAKAPEAQRLLWSLPDAERGEVQSWQPPTDVVFEDRGEHVCLIYDKAEKETEVALTEHGTYCSATMEHNGSVFPNPKAVTVGHVDMVWIHQFRDGTRIAYIGDIKKSKWTTVDGPDTLQCAAYGFACADKLGCDGFCRGLYLAEEGLWQWSGECVMLDTAEAMRLLDTVLQAAANVTGPHCTGAHCWNCWGRLQCPEHLLPAAVGEESEVFRAISLADPGTLDNDAALKLLRWQDAAKKLTETVGNTLKAFAVRTGSIYDPVTGKHWCVTQRDGRESVSVARVREVFGADAEKVIRRGKPYPFPMWLKKRPT